VNASRLLNYNKKNLIKYKLIKDSTSIGIVDFRSVLKNSKTMKKVGKQFLIFEKQLNEKIKDDETKIRKKEKKLLKLNKKNSDYLSLKKEIKQEIAILQKFAFEEKNKLNLSFQTVQKKLKDVLASIIKEISLRKEIDVVILKENAFLFNDDKLDLSKEALSAFDEKTKNLKITKIKSQ
tara:strand:+ start:524 stop:1060 length:537 start_codon:yes stop_codon:yes gene_type:complete